MSTHWNLSVAELFAMGPVVPVLVIKDVAHALPIANALMEGGIKVLEVTLRTEAAMDAIRTIAKEIPDAMVGAGTVTTAEQLQQVRDAGAKFAISPGLTSNLLQAGKEGDIPLIPGVSSISELMNGLDAGYSHFKFFPAEASGGVKSLKAIGGPFPDVTFCPTGGISPSNYLDYLSLKNVACVGGSWLVPDDVVESGDWSTISRLAKQAVDGASNA